MRSQMIDRVNSCESARELPIASISLPRCANRTTPRSRRSCADSRSACHEERSGFPETAIPIGGGGRGRGWMMTLGVRGEPTSRNADALEQALSLGRLPLADLASDDERQRRVDALSHIEGYMELLREP